MHYFVEFCHNRHLCTFLTVLCNIHAENMCFLLVAFYLYKSLQSNAKQINQIFDEVVALPILIFVSSSFVGKIVFLLWSSFIVQALCISIGPWISALFDFHARPNLIPYGFTICHYVCCTKEQQIFEYLFSVFCHIFLIMVFWDLKWLKSETQQPIQLCDKSKWMQ